MCYTEQTWVPTLLIGLETFLGGMETHRHVAVDALEGDALKPSLVEWKPMDNVVAHTKLRALKPSLVEWKLAP